MNRAGKIALGCLLFAGCARLGYTAAPSPADGATGDAAKLPTDLAGGLEIGVPPQPPPPPPPRHSTARIAALSR